MALCTISITAKTTDGAALPNAALTFTPTPADRLTADGGAAIWPLSVQVTCDAGGLGTVALLPGNYALQTVGPHGATRQPVIVPDVLATTLDVLIGAVELPHELIDWDTYAGLVSAAVPPWSSVAAGVAATADGGRFIAVSQGSLAVFKRVGSDALPSYLVL